MCHMLLNPIPWNKVLSSAVAVILLPLVVSSVFAEGGHLFEVARIDSVLQQSGENRNQLDTVLAHYAASGDSLKVEAARFLIAGMGEHSYVTYHLTDSSGNTVQFDAESFTSYDALLNTFDSLEAIFGSLDFERRDRIYDAEIITADFLIENIDLAFRAWRERPWAAFLDFDQFCNFVLPYRGSSEPLEPWRRFFWDKYAWVADSTDDALEAARLINRDVRSWFGFDRRYYYHPTDQGLSEMLHAGLGRCEDMTNLAIYAMRAVGLGVTSDYTPHWGNANNNHAWNAILLPDGRVVPFMGAEADPGEYELINRPAKVYRKTYAPQPHNLAFVDHAQEEVPRWLGGKSFRDVTADYIDPVDVTVALAEQVPDSIEVAYLCVYNWGSWKAMHWGMIEQGRVTFHDMGPEILYIPAFYVNEEIQPCGEPLVANHDGTRAVLQPVEDSLVTMILTHTSGTRLANSTDVRHLKPPEDGFTYRLEVWDDYWRPIVSGMAKDSSLVLEGIPAGGLYRLLSADSDGEQERPFTYEDNRQVWW